VDLFGVMCISLLVSLKWICSMTWLLIRNRFPQSSPRGSSPSIPLLSRGSFHIFAIAFRRRALAAVLHTYRSCRAVGSAPCRLMERPCEPILLGCQTTEQVIRGGYLKHPLVITGLREAGGKQFIRLSKNSRDLHHFLCKEALCRRPLARSLVFEKMAELRNEAYQMLLKEMSESAVPLAGSAVEDLAALLDLDGEANVASVPCLGTGKRRVSNQRLHVQLPATVQVSVERLGQEPWVVELLADPARVAPSMEVSAENFASLFALVDADVSNGDVRRKPHGAARDETNRKGPRGPKDARQYFIKGKWVTKMPKTGAESLKPYGRTFRTLKRRDSGESDGRVRKRGGAKASGRGRGRGSARRTQAVLRDDACDDDCLGDP
jgi:hypothetical protein